MSKRASYREGVEWIALNDEPGEMNPDAIAYFISTLLLADLFGKDPHDVARAVLRVRQQEEAAAERAERRPKDWQETLADEDGDR